MRQKSTFNNIAERAEAIKAAQGLIPVDLVLKHCKILDVFSGAFVESSVAIHKGRIVGIDDDYEATSTSTIDCGGAYIVPGFIDAHVHIESSLMAPYRFQQVTLPRGTTTAIWDPHEIANVKGRLGIEWAVRSTEHLLMDIFVMVPSCVPSTSPELELETSGATLRAGDIRSFKHHQNVLGLAEMMNFPGLLNADADVLQKLDDFQDRLLDGHCPSLSGKALNAYATAGIHSCHESTTSEEAAEKLRKGIHVLIREGSCAKDANELISLVQQRSASQIAMCSDDRNPLDIFEEGHINYIINLGLRLGLSPEDLFRSASYAAAKKFHLEDRGAIAPGYIADLVLVKPASKASDWSEGFDIVDVYKNGSLVTSEGFEPCHIPRIDDQKKNINLGKPCIHASDLKVATKSSESNATEVHVIGVIPNQILTNAEKATLKVTSGNVVADLEQDVLKIAVFERHHATGFHTVAFVKGFGLKSGSIATSINHDCHNIIAVGSSDKAIAEAVNKLIDIDGGIVVCNDKGDSEALPLPIGGLMTEASPEEVADSLRKLKSFAREIGCVLSEPFLQLSFLALPVIPSLKITDRGLVDVTKFSKISLFSEHA